MTATRRIECKTCKRPTNHATLFCESEESHVGEYPDGYFAGTIHEVLKCAGCGEISFVRTNWDIDEANGTEEIFPPRAEIQPLPHLWDVPNKTRGVYLESLRAIHAQCLTLGAIGIRSIIEGISLEQGLSARNLEGKIDGLVTAGFLTQGQSNLLHELRFLGNRAAHELEAPSIEELSIAIDIIETLLKTIYVLPARALRARTKNPS